MNTPRERKTIVDRALKQWGVEEICFVSGKLEIFHVQAINFM